MAVAEEALVDDTTLVDDAELVDDDAAADDDALANVELAPTVWPFLLTTATLAKFVFNPNTALNASACPPVPTVALFAAVVAVEHSEFAALFALQLVWSCWQIKFVIIPMLSADPWSNDPKNKSIGQIEIS